jgi:energy-coupling factor transport system permease protein
MPAAGFLFLMQAFFQPVGTDVIFKFYFLDVTQESLMFAFRNAMRVFVMVSAFTLFLVTTHPSELMSDLTRRGLPGQFAYVIISTLQILPQMHCQGTDHHCCTALTRVGYRKQFPQTRRLTHSARGSLVFGSLMEVEERAIAIEARGFTSKHVKTSLHEIPDPSFDQMLRWARRSHSSFPLH